MGTCIFQKEGASLLLKYGQLSSGGGLSKVAWVLISFFSIIFVFYLIKWHYVIEVQHYPQPKIFLAPDLRNNGLVWSGGKWRNSASRGVPQLHQVRQIYGRKYFIALQNKSRRQYLKPSTRRLSEYLYFKIKSNRMYRTYVSFLQHAHRVLLRPSVCYPNRSSFI